MGNEGRGDDVDDGDDDDSDDDDAVQGNSGKSCFLRISNVINRRGNRN